MAHNTFWDAEVVYHDEGDRLEKIGVHASGLPSDPQRVAEFLKSHNYRNKNVTVQNVKAVEGQVDVAGHPFLGQPNQNLFNAGGRQVNENHEVVQPPPAPPKAT